MSVICSENDCRSFLEGERDELGTPADMLGEGRAGGKEKVFFSSRCQAGLLYTDDRRGCNAIRVSNDQVPALLIGSHSHV